MSRTVCVPELFASLKTEIEVCLDQLDKSVYDHLAECRTCRCAFMNVFVMVRRGVLPKSWVDEFVQCRLDTVEMVAEKWFALAESM